MISLKKISFISICLIAVLSISGMSHATVYFYFDAEDATIGTTLPLASGNPANFCQSECSGSGTKGVIADDGAPQGGKYFRWTTTNNQNNHYTEIGSDTTPSSGWPLRLTMGGTYYLAFYARFDRINGLDVWHEGNRTQSSDKGIEVDGPDIRILATRGQWEHMAANINHHYTTYTSVMKGNNSGVAFGHNRNGYTSNNPYQQEYEKWYAIVLGFTLSNTGSGRTRLWINGELIEEITGLNTVEASGSTVIDRITMGGTIAQPAYDSPAHYRKFDALILTNNWQDIINRGYMSGASNTSDSDSASNPPVFSNHSPAKSSTGFFKDDTISVNVQSDSGVDQSSIQMTVNGQTVPVNVTGSSTNYTVSYKPSSAFPSGQRVAVTISASDLENPENEATESYWFNVARLRIVSNQ